MLAFERFRWRQKYFEEIKAQTQDKIEEEQVYIDGLIPSTDHFDTALRDALVE